MRRLAALEELLADLRTSRELRALDQRGRPASCGDSLPSTFFTNGWSGAELLAQLGEAERQLARSPALG